LRGIAKRCSVIHNGIDLFPYDAPADEQARAALRRELQLPAGVSAIGCVGLLWDAKGQEHLIRALAQIRRSGSPAVVVLVGSGTDETMLRELTDELGVREAVRFAGWREDVPRVLRALDIYVQPSLTEGLPLAVVEAAAAELPIVASDVGGIPEIIEHGRNGLLVPPGDPQALAVAIQELIDDPERARVLAVNARQTAFERFSAEAMASAYMALYERLLSMSD
jgi:glycosyltransferase involved in cell wall biosynthesis